ncbi:MAG: serine/threonine-protein phosphatase [Flavobacteriales bacterium]|nr:serine/threonine-protein phosphatase [Flavobacteriales bacterium]
MWRVVLQFSHPGPRSENQDALGYWISGDGNTMAAAVCDGVGGSPCGALAASTACAAFLDYFRTGDVIPESHGKYLEKEMRCAADFAHQAMIQSVSRKESCAGMATTLVACVAVGQGVGCVHCGDSRLYHIRKGTVLFRTEDHTVALELLRQGVLTSEEAAEAGRGGPLSRALVAEASRQPKAETTLLHPVQPGDILWLCTDGVWAYAEESSWLAFISGEVLNPVDTERKFMDLCASVTRDNFSGIALRYF